MKEVQSITKSPFHLWWFEGHITLQRVYCTWDRPVQTASGHQVWHGVIAWWLRHGWTVSTCSTGVDDAGTQNCPAVDAWCHVPAPWPWHLTSVKQLTVDTIRSTYAIDTVTADTETGLVNGFAWLIYFNVVKNSSRPRPRPTPRLDWDCDRDSSFRAETENETLKFESIVSKLSTEPVGNRRELVANYCVHTGRVASRRRSIDARRSRNDMDSLALRASMWLYLLLINTLQFAIPYSQPMESTTRSATRSRPLY